MTLEELRDEYAKDSTIHYNDPNLMTEDAAKGNMLHEKYGKILSTYRLTYKALLRKKETVQFWLEGYYLQGIYLEELKRTAKSPYIAKTKDQAEKMAKADPMYTSLMNQVENAEEFMLYCKEIVEYLRYCRGNDIKNWIEIKKYYSGM